MTRLPFGLSFQKQKKRKKKEINMRKRRKETDNGEMGVLYIEGV